MLMNKDLFPSDKDAEIADLRRLIAKYKAYDKERTRQYKDLLKENEWLRDEIKTVSSDEKLARRVSEQRKCIECLQQIINANNFRKDFSQEYLDAVKLYKEKADLTRTNSKLQAEVKNLREEISKLVYKTSMYENNNAD